MQSESPLSSEKSALSENSAVTDKNTAEIARPPAVQHSFSTLNELIDQSALRFANQPVIGMAFEEPLTYHQFNHRIHCLAKYMQSLNIQHGDRIALLAENSHNWGAAYLAIVRLGAVAVPILPDLLENDVRHIISEMKCDLIFITQKQIEKIYDLKDKIKTIITLDDCLHPLYIRHLRIFQGSDAEPSKSVRQCFVDKQTDRHRARQNVFVRSAHFPHL
jgi:long-chain acyl-CoA synthetase